MMLMRLARHRPALGAVIITTLALGAAAVLCLVAAAACVIPTRRAATVDPMTAMRIE